MKTFENLHAHTKVKTQMRQVKMFIRRPKVDTVNKSWK